MTVGCKKEEIPMEDFSVQYIRTNGYVESRKYPIITIVSSKNELEKYYQSYEVTNDLTEFKEATNVYSNVYFTNSFLIIIMLQEGSGSIGHNVEKIETNGDITISRLIPAGQTADMAVRSVIIELNNNYKVRRFRVRLIDKLLY
jgi:hypothetical protein